MTATYDRIADFVLTQQDDAIPAAARDAAALMTLDTLGVAIASAHMEAGQIARETAVALYGAGSPDHSARLMLDGRAVSLAGAAFAAATHIDNLDAHDGYNPTKGHIGVVVVPALFALAQQRSDLTGRAALAAVVVGYEIAGRAGLALHASVSDYHTSGAWNALGVAAVAARLRGQTRAMLRQSLGIAEYHGPRSQMMREIANPTMLHDGSGWGAMVGISAAVLAERGFTGAPAITAEAAAAADHWSDLGRFWQMQHQYVKPYPICRWAHAAIDAVRALMQTHGLDHHAIRHVRINSFHQAVCLFGGVPSTTSQAQYSLRFAVAAWMVHGRIGVEQITGAGLTDPQVGDLLTRIDVAETDEHSARFPAARTADVTITTRDGRQLHSGDTHARGGTESPLSRSEVIAKFMDLAVPVLGQDRSGAIRDATLSLTGDGSRFADLIALLTQPPAAEADWRPRQDLNLQPIP